jgi:hypothetical protein
MNILIPSHSMCKQNNIKIAAPVEIKNRTHAGKNNKCTCFASRHWRQRWTTEDQPISIRTVHWKRGKTGLFKNVEYCIGWIWICDWFLNYRQTLVWPCSFTYCSLTSLGSDGIVSSFYAILALMPWFSTGSMVSLIPSFITYRVNLINWCMALSL